MDREKFGEFVAEKRKELNMTQKDLADKLLVSDKAVSKWERGLSYPDITLLEPLSHILSVSITELLEGKKMDNEEKIDRQKVDEMIKETIEINSHDVEKEKREKGYKILIGIALLLVAAFESLVLVFTAKDVEQLSTYYWTVEGLVVLFGVYFWIFTKEKLPVYYDENKIDFYTDGFMRMNVPGVSFNNSNWPHILGGLRKWCWVVGVIFPIFAFVADRFITVPWLPTLFIALGFIFSMFFVIYANAKKG